MKELQEMYLEAIRSLKARINLKQVTYEQAQMEFKLINEAYSFNLKKTGNENH